MSRLKLVSIVFAITQALAAAAQTSAECSAAEQLIQEGDQLYSGGKYAEALDKFKAVPKDSESHRRATNMVGICQAMLGKRVEARQVFKGMLAKNPSDPWALSNLAWLDLISKSWKSSVAWGKKAIKADPKSGQTHYNLATAYAGLKDVKKVVSHLKEAAAIDPGFLDLALQNSSDFAPVAKSKAFRAFLIASIQGKPQNVTYDYAPCGVCYATGKVNCNWCYGNRQQSCSTCGGRGRQYNGQYCYGCSGSGRQNCSGCYGSGKKSCGYCAGLGAIAVPRR
ncbi:MAG: hypothetical protein HONBIEJF_02219 [Fimbriimonadaceae bacterium]|nr:hypothetical protein [Fimbriimonadaceae bacterium]